jgi:hypothetical protein
MKDDRRVGKLRSFDYGASHLRLDGVPSRFAFISPELTGKRCISPYLGL